MFLKSKNIQFQNIGCITNSLLHLL